jgi:HEAT repeat protein
MTEIDQLVRDLASADGMIRRRARETLVDLGSPAVASLVELLNDPRNQVRWEAASALGAIADPAAAEALVALLGDRVFDVRWLAAKGLIAVGRDSALPLLHGLITSSGSKLFREGAHHVIHDLLRRDEELGDALGPVLVALEDAESSVEAPLAAETAINELTGR